MASNKDILEAQRYNRRRLVTAFSAGTPGGKELDAPNPLRPLMVGGAIAVVILIVAAVMGRFSPSLVDGWDNQKLIIVKSTGSRFYTINGVLRPITNITSAKLLTDAGSYSTTEVKASVIEGLPRGTEVGITGVPDDVPAGKDLASSEWLSCSLKTGTHTWIADTPDGVADAQAVLVTNAGSLYLITDGTRYRIDDTTSSGILLALGLDAVVPVEVGADWLDLFERGSDLTALEIKGAGSPVTGMPDRLSTAVIGTIIEVEEDTADRLYVVTGNGTIAPLTDTAERLYRISVSGTVTGNPLTTTVAELSSVTVDPLGVAPADWPAEIGSVIETDSVPCARLVLEDTGARTQLVQMTAEGADEAAQTITSTAKDGTTTSAITGSITVTGGSGALVRAGSGGTLGATMFISDLGVAHGLGEDPTDSLGRLGWTENDVVLVPSAWTRLVPEGPALLSSDAWDTVGVR